MFSFLWSMPTLPISLVFPLYYLDNGHGDNMSFSLSTAPLPINPPTAFRSEFSSWNTRLTLLLPCWSSVLSTFHDPPLPLFLQPHFSAPTVFQTDCLGNSRLIGAADSFFFRRHSVLWRCWHAPSRSHHQPVQPLHSFTPVQPFSPLESSEGRTSTATGIADLFLQIPIGTLQPFTNLFLPSELGFWCFKAEIWPCPLFCASSEWGNKLSLNPTSLLPRTTVPLSIPNRRIH